VTSEGKLRAFQVSDFFILSGLVWNFVEYLFCTS